MKKAKNYFKILLLLSGISLTMINCQKETIPHQTQWPNSEIVSLEEAEQFFIDTRSSRKKQNVLKDNDIFDITPDWSTFRQEELINSNTWLTSVNASIEWGENSESELLFIKIDNEMKNAIYTICTDSLASDGSILKARFYLHNLNGTLIEGYRIDHDILSKYIHIEEYESRQYQKNKTRQNKFGDDGDEIGNEDEKDLPLELGGKGGGDCYNTGNLPKDGCLDEVVLSKSIRSFNYDKLTFAGSCRGYCPGSMSTNGSSIGLSPSQLKGYTTSTIIQGKAPKTAEDSDSCPKDFQLYRISGEWVCVKPVSSIGVDKIINKLTNECARNIFTEIENGIFEDHPMKPEVQVLIDTPLTLNFSELILKLFNDNDYVNLTVKNGNTGASNAFTLGATITIGDNYLKNATKLSIARTIIHESVHAYINALYSNVVNFNSYSFQQKLNKFAEDNGLNVNSNVFHHSFMGQYLDAMAYSLYEWDSKHGTGGNLDWEYYKSMVYSGMFQVDLNGKIVIEIDTFKELVPNESDRQKIANIIINEQNGNTDAKGTKCN